MAYWWNEPKGGGKKYPAPPSGGGGFSDPYATAIKQNPALMALRAMYEAASVSDAAQRAQAIQKALIQFGEVPEGFDLDVTPETSQLAGENTQAGLSSLARLAKWNTDQRRDIASGLAARGMLRSGEYGHQLGEQALGFKQQQYDSRQQLLDYLNGLQQAFLAAERQRQFDMASKLMAVGADLSQQPWLWNLGR